MERQELNSKITSGLWWSYLERVSAQAVSVFVAILLARILLPQDYGIVSIVLIFITICDALVVGGFSDALIQKQKADDLDFSSLFWFVLAGGFLLYGLLVLIAPCIEAFFKVPHLALILTVMGIRIPINAIKSIQSAYISKQMKYKYFFIATSFGTGISAVVGIVMALSGAGVWALVTQYLTNSVIDTAVIWITCDWHPHLRFDIERLKELYTFGWKMQLSSLLTVLYNELEVFCIGKKYSVADLAFYERGKQFPQLIMRNIQTSISKVMLPTFSLLQTDVVKSKEYARKSIRISAFIMFPALIGLILCAHEFVIALLTEKWVASVIYLQILSVVYICEPVLSINRQVLIASGDSKQYLFIEIQKKSIGLVLLFCALVFFNQVFWVAVSVMITQLVSLILQSRPVARIIAYPLSEQGKDVLVPLLFSLAMAFPILLLKQLQWNIWLKFFAQIFAGGAVYIFLAVLTQNPELKILVRYVSQTYRKLTHKEGNIA